ncbi:MAG TPA: hypothetical protein VIS27_08665 [Yeosuana sp.]
MPLRNEIVRVGNNTARIKNFYANGLIILYDVEGSFQAGDSIVGDDSGETIVLEDFELDDFFDLNYDEWEFDLENSSLITLDTGSYIAQDAHFTGAPSQEYQTVNLISLVEEGE